MMIVIDTNINRLLDEMTTRLLAEFDLETRYLARAERGKGKQQREATAWT
jgi:hypothetical protein